MSIAYGGIIAFLFRGLNVLTAFGVVWLTSDELGDAGRGAFVLGLAFVGIVTAIAAGLGAATAYEVANRGRPPMQVLASGAIPAAALALLCVGAGLALARSLSGENASLALPAGVAAAAIVANSTVSGVLLGRGAFIRYNLALVLPPVFALICVVFTFFVLDRVTAGAALGAYAAGQWLAGPVLIAFVAGGDRAPFRPDRALVMGIVSFGVVAAASGVISFLNYRADLFVVEHFEGRDSVGVYGNAVYVAEAVWQMGFSLALAAYARVAAADAGEAADITARLLRHTLIALGVVCVVLFASAGLVVDAFFPPGFSGMTAPLRILLPGTLVYGLAAALSGYYTYQRGQPWFGSLIAGIALVIGIGLAILLVPRMAEEGAALATTISYIVAMTVALWMFVRASGMSLGAVFRFGRHDLDDYRVLLRRARAAFGG